MEYHFMKVQCSKYPSISTQIPYKNLTLMKKHIENFIEYEDWFFLIDLHLQSVSLEEFKELIAVLSPNIEIPDEITTSSGLFRYLVEIVKVNYLVVNV